MWLKGSSPKFQYMNWMPLGSQRLVHLCRRIISPLWHLWLSRKGITQGSSLRCMEKRLRKVETSFLEPWLTPTYAIPLSLISTYVAMLGFRAQAYQLTTMSSSMRTVSLLMGCNSSPTTYATRKLGTSPSFTFSDSGSSIILIPILLARLTLMWYFSCKCKYEWCIRSASIVRPAYYAHLAMFRAWYYDKPSKGLGSTSIIGSGTQESAATGAGAAGPLVTFHHLGITSRTWCSIAESGRLLLN